MSLEGLPGITRATQIFVQEVRGYLRDHAELNRLLSGVESSDRQIAWAVVAAVEKFNGSPPMSDYGIDTLLRLHQSDLLRRMAVMSLLEGVGMLQTRNHINYSAGGMSVGVNDKTPLIMRWLEYFNSSVPQELLRVKVAMNIEEALGGVAVPSEMWSVNSTYSSY